MIESLAHLRERLAPPNLPPKESVTQEELTDYTQFVRGEIAKEERGELENYYSSYVVKRRKRLERLNCINPEIGRATGELPMPPTKYDVVSNPQMITPEEEVIAYVGRHLYLQMLTHPTVMRARSLFEESGFPTKIIRKDLPLVDKLREQGHAITFYDLGLGPKEEGLEENTPDSATEILGTKMFTWLTKDLSCYPVILPSMNTVVSFLGLATLAIAGTAGFIPIDAQFNDVNSQVLMARQAISLLENDPVVQESQDREKIIERGRKLIGATLKANPEDALRRVERLLNEGITTYRLYDPRSLIGRMNETTKVLTREYGDEIRLIVGQVAGPNHANILIEAGADALIIGRADGSSCTTGTVTRIVPNNPYVTYDVINNIKESVPIWIDSGLDTPAMAGVFGGGAMMSRLLAGGTFEQAPVGYYYQLADGSKVKEYSGEASEPTKDRGGKKNRAGGPMFVEGDAGYIKIEGIESLSVAEKLFDILGNYATTLIFLRQHSAFDFQRFRDPELFIVGSNAQQLSKSYVNSKSFT